MNPFRFFRNLQPNLFSKIWTHQKTLSRCCSIRRAVYFIPGHNGKLLGTALNLKVDCLVLDCEKLVPIQQKDEARQNIRNLLDKGPVTENDPEWCIRINPVQTPHLCEADITALLSAKYLPITISLPKINNVNQLEWFTEKVWKTLLQRGDEEKKTLKLMLHVESATAMMSLVELCQKAVDLSTMAPIVLDALIFESDALLDSIGARKTSSGIEILHIRQQIVLIAKSFGLQVIDKPYYNTSSFKGLRECCSDGIILGFTGKQVIHMDQIVITQEEFTPSRNKIHWAKTVLKAHKESQEMQQEDFGFDNSLVDAATVKQAEYILNVAKAAGVPIESPHKTGFDIQKRES